MILLMAAFTVGWHLSLAPAMGYSVFSVRPRELSENTHSRIGPCLGLLLRKGARNASEMPMVQDRFGFCFSKDLVEELDVR